MDNYAIGRLCKSVDQLVRVGWICAALLAILCVFECIREYRYQSIFSRVRDVESTMRRSETFGDFKRALDRKY